MPLLYERTESDSEVMIRYKHIPIVNAIGIVAAFCVMYAILNDHLLIGVAIFAIVFPVKLLWSKPTKEVNAAKLHGTVSVSGSKWSFSSPLTIMIPKTTERDIQQDESTVPSKAAPSASSDVR